MAETTVLRSSSIVRNASSNATSSRPQAALSGVHPVVQVNMNNGGAQVNGGQQQVRQGVTILPPKGGTLQFRTGGLPNQPAKQSVVILPPKNAQIAAATSAPLTADQLLLCRHLADKYLDELKSSEAQGEAAINNVKLAEATITAIDATMVAMTATAAMAAAPKPQPQRNVAAGSRSTQGLASVTTRRVARPAPPPVIVTMADGKPVPSVSTEQPEQAPSLEQIENDAQV